MIKTLFFFAGFLFLTLFLNQKIKTVMAALDDLKAAVQKETEVDQSAIVLLIIFPKRVRAGIKPALTCLKSIRNEFNPAKRI